MLADELRRKMDAAGLPRGLLAHIDRVVAEAAMIAERQAVAPELVALAAQGHDVARARPPDELLRLATDFALPLTDVDRKEPILLHGPVGAELLTREYGVDDGTALRAARYHTTAFANMDVIERIVFVADKVEPNKRRNDADLERIRELALADLDGAALALLNYAIARALDKGWGLHPWLVEARNSLVLS
jgi:predicted HD superfamily hydrolase involved in NAD metabolism